MFVFRFRLRRRGHVGRGIKRRAHPIFRIEFIRLPFTTFQRKLRLFYYLPEETEKKGFLLSSILQERDKLRQTDFDFCDGSKGWEDGRGLHLSLGLHHLAPNQLVEVRCQMAAEERLARRDGEEGGQELGREAGFVDQKTAVDTASPHVGRVLRQVHGSEPFHHSVVGPHGHLVRRRLGRLFGNRAALQATRVVVVEAEHLQTPPDANEVK